MSLSRVSDPSSRGFDGNVSGQGLAKIVREEGENIGLRIKLVEESGGQMRSTWKSREEECLSSMFLAVNFAARRVW